MTGQPSVLREMRREHRRRRSRRQRRRAYLRSVYLLPSLATLGNAICGFAACWVVAFDAHNVGLDQWALRLLPSKFLVAAYLILLAMVFDALDGRLARFTRHTTDFGGQLDSMADVVSFGMAPAFIALALFKSEGPDLPMFASRLVWSIAALYFSCAAIRLARFNVSNEHGEQHHFSFLGLPSPGAAGAVIGLILMEQDLSREAHPWLAMVCIVLLPLVVLGTGLLMVSNLRYPHIVNRHMRGRRSIARLLAGVILILLIIVAHRYVIGLATITYAGLPAVYALLRLRSRSSLPAQILRQPPSALI